MAGVCAQVGVEIKDGGNVTGTERTFCTTFISPYCSKTKLTTVYSNLGDTNRMKILSALTTRVISYSGTSVILIGKVCVYKREESVNPDSKKPDTLHFVGNDIIRKDMNTNSTPNTKLNHFRPWIIQLFILKRL